MVTFDREIPRGVYPEAVRRRARMTRESVPPQKSVNSNVQPPLQVFIVDDEFQSRNLLCKLLTDNFPNVTITGQASNIKEAITGLNKHTPDLLFLDIEMQGETGFDLLQQLNNIKFQILNLKSLHEMENSFFRIPL